MARRKAGAASVHKAPPSKISPETLELGVAKLEESGLTLEDAEALGITLHDNLQQLSPNYDPVPGLRLMYHHPITREPLEWWPKLPPFERCRKLRDEEGAFGGTKEGKPKYSQPTGTRTCAYFPLTQDWAELALDPSVSLFITEGELKAAKACKEGFPTIGLGGVDSWAAKRSGYTFLPELELIQWPRRKVYVVYDSDARSNPNVARAINALAEALCQRGAFPYYVALPDVYTETDDKGNVKKTGFDDYLVVEGASEFEETVVETAAELAFGRVLWELNDKVVYVRDPGMLIERTSGTKFTPAAFTQHRFSAKSALSKVVNAQGDVNYVEVSAASAWLQWTMRAEADRVDYDPSKRPRDLVSSGEHLIWNMWPGWGTEPAKGNVKPFLELCNHLFTGAEPGDLEWFYQWLAYPIQHPGTKLFTSVLIWGVDHGTGKSLIGYTMKRIYGKNFNELNQKNLYKDFNQWAENKQFVMGDDITGTDKRHESDILKKFITQEDITINIKHLPEFTIRDVINYYFTANGPVALFLEDNDRRSFVHEVTSHPLPEAFYKAYAEWLKTGGANALHQWLLDVDISKFNPAAPARKTMAKQRMIIDGRSDLGSWVAKLIEDPDFVLRVGEIALKADLFTTRELLQLYDPAERVKVTANGLGRELRRVGVGYVHNGAPIRIPGMVSDRFYILRNQERWLKASLAEVKAHITQHHNPMPKEPKF